MMDTSYSHHFYNAFQITNKTLIEIYNFRVRYFKKEKDRLLRKGAVSSHCILMVERLRRKLSSKTNFEQTNGSKCNKRKCLEKEKVYDKRSLILSFLNGKVSHRSVSKSEKLKHSTRFFTNSENVDFAYKNKIVLMENKAKQIFQLYSQLNRQFSIQQKEKEGNILNESKKRKKTKILSKNEIKKQLENDDYDHNKTEMFLQKDKTFDIKHLFKSQYQTIIDNCQNTDVHDALVKIKKYIQNESYQERELPKDLKMSYSEYIFKKDQLLTQLLKVCIDTFDIKNYENLLRFWNIFIPNRTLDSCHECKTKVTINSLNDISVSYHFCENRKKEFVLKSQTDTKKSKTKEKMIDRDYLKVRCQIVSVPKCIFEEISIFLSEFQNINISKTIRPKIIEFDPFKEYKIKSKNENKLYFKSLLCSTIENHEKNNLNIKGKTFVINDTSEFHSWANLPWTRKFYASCPHLFKKELTYKEKNWWTCLSRNYVMRSKKNIFDLKKDYKKVWKDATSLNEKKYVQEDFPWIQGIPNLTIGAEKNEKDKITKKTAIYAENISNPKKPERSSSKRKQNQNYLDKSTERWMAPINFDLISCLRSGD